MSATFVSPEDTESYPVVVMVAGSGPTDRDWNSPLLPGRNGSAKLIASELAKAGIASLRYDKRPSGPNLAQNMALLIEKLSMQSHLDELDKAVETAVKQRGVEEDELFILGNSEGTIHALNYAIESPSIPPAGLVLIAPPGRGVATVAREQLAEQAGTIANGDALLALYDEAVERFSKGQPADADPALPVGVQNLIKSLESPANLPFSRELWRTNTADLLEQVTAPVLVVIGKKDIQVSWERDGNVLQKAAEGKKNVTFDFPADANHILKYEPKPRSELAAEQVFKDYNAEDTRLDEAMMNVISAWIERLA
jgi:hypothetical protein